MRRPISLAPWAFLLLAPLAAAQVPKAEPGLLKRHAALVAEYDSAFQKYREEQKKITSSDEYRELRASRDVEGLRALMAKLVSPDAAFYPRFAELAEAAAGTQVEVAARLWMLSHTRDAEARRTNVETLVERFPDEHFWLPHLRMVSFALGLEKGGEILAKFATNSPHEDIRIMARYLRATSMLRNRASSDEDKAAARAEFGAIVREHPDSIPAMQIQGPEFIEKHLQIGMVAPDIEGEDLEGVPFKLSDYRGKVVVLDFWGDW